MRDLDQSALAVAQDCCLMPRLTSVSVSRRRKCDRFLPSFDRCRLILCAPSANTRLDSSVPTEVIFADLTTVYQLA